MAVRAVFLVGFMACGKTTIGRQLAKRLDWDFVDLDALIEAREKRSIANIFRERGEYGENGYRDIEARALHALTSSLKRDTVIALGGGTFYYPRNRDLLRSWPSVFLEAPVEELWQRSQEDEGKRPLRRDNPSEFRDLYERRLPEYRKATVTIVTSGKDPSSLCAEIESILQVRGGVESSASTQVPPTHIETGESQ
jgi:shikimate kinase